VLDVSDDSGQPPIEGRDAVMAFVAAALSTAVTAHQVHFPEISIDGDTALTVFPMMDRVILGPGKASFTGYGHYHHSLVRRDGEWKIARMRLARLHIDQHPAAQERGQ
jgi:hypothetical protein